MSPRIRRWLTIGAVATFVWSVGSLFHPTVVVGESMEPTLKSGRVIWVDRFYYAAHRPQRGEVVVFKLDGKTYVKRVYRGPGERLHYMAAGNEWVAPVHERNVDELRKSYRRLRSSIRVREMHVPEDSVFVLGDNYMVSEDSRELGPIPLSSIVGRAHLEADETTTASCEVAPLSPARRRRIADPERRTRPATTAASAAAREPVPMAHAL